MTLIGKILAVLVLLLALVWMWFTVSVFVARTNWKSQAETYKAAYAEARTARETEHGAYQAEKDALERQVLSYETRVKGLTEQIAKLQADAKGSETALANANMAAKNAEANAAELTARVQGMTDEVKKTRDRNNNLEDERVVLVIKKEQAEKDRQAAENLARQASGDKLLAEQRLEELRAELSETRSGGTSASAKVLNSFGTRPAALPEGVRGTITAYRDGYAALSIGIDAGLTNGAVLDVYRSEGGGQYLGTVTVERVYPKEAVGKFKPADPLRTIGRLRPEELPKAGDTVGKIGGTLSTLSP